MAYCRNCGMPIDETKEICCSRCGVFVNGAPVKAKKDSNKTIIIVLLCILIVLCVVCLSLVFAINRDNNAPATDTTQETEATTAVQSTVQQPETAQMSAPVYIPPETTAYIDYSQTAYPFTAGSHGYVAYRTPAHAGVNLRKYNDVNSVIIITLAEGTWVTLAETRTVYGDGYVKVTTSINGVNYTGYILAKYIDGIGGLGDDGRGDDYEGYLDSYYNRSEYFVSYNTPSHAGINIRTKATSYSEVLITLPEGASLDYVDLQNANDYCYVETFYNGNYYRGYVLTKYIAS